MAKEFSKAFYKSKQWQHTRDAYFKYRNGLCEDCLSKGLYVPGEIVHHKIELTPENINNPMIALDFGNLKLVCRECHLREHGKKIKRFKINADGTVECR